MRIYSITIKNYRPFKELREVKFGQLTTIIGKNDAGKSSILRAIQLFFEKKPKIDSDDFSDHADPDDDVLIEIAFTSLPREIEIEEGIRTSFKDEMLLDENGCLRIRKVYPRDNPTKVRISLITQDFSDDFFSGLVNLKEDKLNKKCEETGIDFTKAGRGVTNKDKRRALRDKAKEMGIEIGERELEISTRDKLWSCIESLLPEFYLFESETRTEVGEASFQRIFRPIIKEAVEHPDATDTKQNFTRVIETALQEEVSKIYEKLKRHTDEIHALTAKPVFQWEKAVELRIYGRDRYGVDKPLEKRGSGIRRLLMVSVFEHLAEKENEKATNIIFGVEEPENSLHPGLQRELTNSFQRLADQGSQVIITSHSPVFAGASPIENLTLIVRHGGIAQAIQHPELKLEEIARELGVEPADQITCYKACVFVEGKDDIMFWNTVAEKLKAGGYISSDFGDKGIGFVLVGGSNLKYWISIQAMKRLTRRFAVIVDSDKKSRTESIPQKKEKWKECCEKDGGVFIILRKREIENYLHPEAIKRAGKPLQKYDDYTDMKKLYGKNIINVIQEMTPDEILEMSKYEENGIERYELKEIVETLLDLANYC